MFLYPTLLINVVCSGATKLEYSEYDHWRHSELQAAQIFLSSYVIMAIKINEYWEVSSLMEIYNCFLDLFWFKIVLQWTSLWGPARLLVCVTRLEHSEHVIIRAEWDPTFKETIIENNKHNILSSSLSSQKSELT